VIARARIALFSVLAGVLLWPIACSTKEDTLVIQEMIQTAARSAEEHAVAELMELTGPAFVAQPGGHNFRTTRGILLTVFRHYGRFRVHYPQPDISISESRAEAEAVVYFLIVRQEQTIPGLKELYRDPRRWLEKASQKADLYQLRLTLRKIDDRWKVRQAHLEGFKGYGFDT
jgi:hypothetical protein